MIAGARVVDVSDVAESVAPEQREKGSRLA